MPLQRLFKKLSKRTSSLRPDTKDHPSGDGKPTDSSNADSESYGLKLLNEPLSYTETESVHPVDVVFVHGLNGHWERTWTHENGTFWPKDLLPHDLPGARVFSYGYPAQVFASKSVAGLRDFAKHLLDDLALLRNEPSRPIIYVCHSLGGIVVKQALIIAHQRSVFKGIWSASKAIVFMGTPHRGSRYSNLGETLGNIANLTLRLSSINRFTGDIRTSLIKALAQENGELQGISEDFYSLVQESVLHIVSLYEREAHPLTSRPIVELYSAHLGVRDEKLLPLYLDHQNLCRFSGPQDTNYQKVSNLIKSEVPKDLGGDKTMTSSIYTDHSYDETEKACVSLLNTVDVADYESKIDSRVKGTLEWILQIPQYNDWASNPEARLLWVTGFVGCGKTVLASFISRYLNEQHSRALICRFFCDEKIAEFRDPCALLRSLIFQIVDKRRRLWRLVKKASDAGGFHIFSQFDALWNLFIQLARTEKKYPIMIIIDAIDEFDRDAHYRLAACIFELLSHGNETSVKFFVTSRPNAEGDFDFRTRSRQTVHLSMGDSKGEIDRDIRSVVHHRLERMVNRGACQPLVRDTLEGILVAKADQTFLWITLVLPLLEKRLFLPLDEATMIVNHLPMTLASLYRHLLLSIPESDQDIAARILRLLVICDRPLTGEEIGMMLTIKPHYKSASSLTKEGLPPGQKAVEAVLGNLVRIHGSHVVLVHQSLKDYITSLSRGTQDTLATRFGVDRIRDTRKIFRACSLYLALEEFQQDIHISLDATEDFASDDTESIPSRSSSLYGFNIFDEPSFKDDFFANESTRAMLNAKYRLFDYAALHWASDFSICSEIATKEDQGTALLLCKTNTAQLTNWFRYYWYSQGNFEIVPTVLDSVMVVSYLGHTSSLRHLLLETDPIDTESISRGLYWAARQGNSACVILLLQQPSCDPQYSAINGQAPLLAAAQFGRLDCVSLLVKDDRVYINTQDASGRTALSLGISNSHTEIVTALLAHASIDVNLQDNRLNTPLQKAVDVASDSILDRLLTDKRAEVDRQDRRGRNILSWAAELGAEKCASLIIRDERILVDQKDFGGRTALSYASQHGHLPVVKKLIEIGSADPLGKDENGRNAHSWAAGHRSPEVLRYLTRKFPQGADVPDRDGWTPVAWALDPPGYPENVLLLLKYATINVKQRDGTHGRTILAWTASYGHTQIASELVNRHDLDLDARDMDGRTPLSEAAGNGSLGVVQLLIGTEKVEVASRDRLGQTPLSWAARGGHLDVVELLLSCPATILDAQNDFGETALDIARKCEHKEVVLTLESWTR